MIEWYAAPVAIVSDIHSAFFLVVSQFRSVYVTDFTVLLAALKTDLSLLLECLKFQMKCPEMQKHALLTIHSICEKRGMR